MKQRIYTSSFRTGPHATKKQQMLFATDTAYALSEGYNLIEDSQGVVYEIIDEHNLVELELGFGDDSDENFYEPTTTEVEFDPTEPIKAIDNCAMIDLVIHNTLKRPECLSPDQVGALIKLAKLKIILESAQ